MFERKTTLQSGCSDCVLIALASDDNNTVTSNTLVRGDHCIGLFAHAQSVSVPFCIVWIRWLHGGHACHSLVLVEV